MAKVHSFQTRFGAAASLSAGVTYRARAWVRIVEGAVAVQLKMGSAPDTNPMTRKMRDVDFGLSDGLVRTYILPSAVQETEGYAILPSYGSPTPGAWQELTWTVTPARAAREVGMRNRL